MNEAVTESTIPFLIKWTPFLLEGFMWNVLIAVCAVALGSSVGAVLAWMRVRGKATMSALAEGVTTVMGSLPTLALIFYAVYVLPADIQIPGTAVSFHIPAWIKAVIGLSAAPMSFTATSLVVAYRNWEKGDISAALLFVPNWINVFLISFVASSASSLVGVSELVSRCNTVIAASGTDVMMPVYLYCSIYFVLTSLLFTSLINRLRESKFMAGINRQMSSSHSSASRAK